jgi:RNAse (barnase) inhibitor barstar
MLDASAPVLMPADSNLDDVELQVLNDRGEVMGRYYIGLINIIEASRDAAVTHAEVILSFRGYHCPFAYAGEIWKRWHHGPPRQRDEWRALPAHKHESWLHVTQMAWFSSGRSATRYSREHSYIIHGGELPNIHSFYCALGEAMNGPGGYFGSSLDGLDDCLTQSATSAGPFSLFWRHFNQSVESLQQDVVDDLLALFRDHGVRVITEAGGGNG